MSVSDPRLLAASWTFAGDVVPGSGERSPWSIGARIDAVAEAGFTGIELDIVDLRNNDLGEIRRMLNGTGITFVQLQLMNGWWHGPTDDDLFLIRSAPELGAVQIKAAPFQADVASLDAIKRSWWLVSERARVSGARLALEPQALSSVRTIEDGARFVQAVGHPNGGLLVDAWHASRGGSTFASMREAIDPAYLFGVELCDGRGPAPTGLEFVHDSNDNRRLPGDGEWDVAGFVRVLRSIGYDGPWGVEISSIEHRALSLLEALGRASISTRAVLGKGLGTTLA
jgi:sugar phosphate isomerase/epimerase